MTESADGDGSQGESSDEIAKPAGPPADEPSAIPSEVIVPPTRRRIASPLAVEPASPPGPHAGDALGFPDDGLVSGWLRRADLALGVGEQAVLFALLGAVVLTAAAAALADRLLGVDLGQWRFDIVRGGTFSIAMIGAVFASHQQRHLAMDLVSRRLPPRGRLVLRVVLALFTVAVAMLLVRSGLHQLDTVGEERGERFISTHTLVMFMPIGAGLIIVHTILHMVIDLDYLARGKTPPARMRSGH